MTDSSPIAAGTDTSPLRGEVAAERRVRGVTKRARALRRSETDAEHRLWQIVRARQVGGFKFVRQFPVGPYYADFACREVALIIELDDSQHDESVADDRRTAYLNAQGYSVLRLWNTDLLLNPRGAAEAILAALNGHPSPGWRFAPAAFSPQGRGTKGVTAATAKKRGSRSIHTNHAGG